MTKLSNTLAKLNLLQSVLHPKSSGITAAGLARAYRTTSLTMDTLYKRACAQMPRTYVTSFDDDGIALTTQTQGTQSHSRNSLFKPQSATTNLTPTEEAGNRPTRR